MVGAWGTGENKVGRNPPGTCSPVMSEFPQREDVLTSAWVLENFLEMLPRMSLKGSRSVVAGLKVGWGQKCSGVGGRNGRGKEWNGVGAVIGGGKRQDRGVG